MKKKLAALATVVGLISSGMLYPDTGIVTEMDYAKDTVTIEMANGNEFAFYGTEDYDKGDLVGVIMWSSGTPKVYDDEILKANYVGTLCQFNDIVR